MIIFLDFDGVTHPWPVQEGAMFDKNCLNNLNNALKNYSVDIVITSTWRENISLSDLKMKLGVIGHYVRGVTPVIDDPFMHHVRYYEIQLYLKNYNKVDNWIAIDDTAGFFPTGMSNLFLTNPRTGFTQNDSEALINKISYQSNN